MATNEIKLTGREYTITFTQNMYDYVIEHSLFNSLKAQIYTNYEGIDLAIEHNGSLLISLRDKETNPHDIFNSVFKWIGQHKLSQRTREALVVH